MATPSGPASGDKEPTVISGRAPMEMAAVVSVPFPVEPERVGPGMRLGQFELLEYVGGGGMGRVFRAHDSALARTVAVKILSREQATDGEILLRFRNEAQTAARLNHESIVQIYHVGEHGGLPYIVFEFVEGLNIRALVEHKGVLPLAEAISYTFQVAEALAHAAAHNVVHRDIKPSNVLITAAGQAKLIDLGLARLQKIGDGSGDLTASGVTLGTFDYISPEQARDPRTADVRSDIYSLGCTLFFMLAGRPPFAEGTVLQKLLQHQGEEPPDVRHFRPELPHAVSRLVRRMMAKDPRRRFQSPQQLIEAMAQLAEQVGLHPAGPGEPHWVPDQAPQVSLLQRHLPWMAPVVVLVLAVLLLDFFWSAPSPQSGAWPTLPPQNGASAPAAPESQAAPSAEPGSSAAAPRLENGTASGAEKTATASSPAGEKAVDPTPPGSGGASPPAVAPAAPTPAPAPLPPDPKNAPPAALTEGAATPPAGAGLRPEGPGGGVSLSGADNSAILPGAASGATAATPAETATPAVTPAAKPAAVSAPAAKGTGVGVLIVDPAGSGANTFSTLGAACAAAASGDVIELRFNGPRVEPPLDVRTLRLTIRAAEGFQPTVLFRPAAQDPAKQPKAMLEQSGGQLTLLNLALEFEVPREASSDQWSLVEIRQSEMTRLEKCVLTIRNSSDQLGAYHPDAAFFRVKAAPRASALAAAEAPAPPTRATIALIDCVLRGEAVVLRAHDLAPIQFSWENGLLATSEHLLVADGGEKADAAGETIQLGLQHVTAVARAGLCRFDRSAAMPRLPVTQVTCANSILVGGPSAPLIEHLEVLGAESGRRAFAWNGDRNFYEGFVGFWALRQAGPPAPSPQLVAFDDWRALWGPQRENVPHWNRVQWRQLPSPDRPVHTHVPADYALNPSHPSANPALGAASDARDAGLLPDRLPVRLAPAPPPQPAGTPPAPQSPAIPSSVPPATDAVPSSSSSRPGQIDSKRRPAVG